MTNRELIKLLLDHNLDAKFQVVVENYPHPFELCFGGAEGCTKKTCLDVSLHVGGTSESAEREPAVAKGGENECSDEEDR